VAADSHTEKQSYICEISSMGISNPQRVTRPSHHWYTLASVPHCLGWGGVPFCCCLGARPGLVFFLIVGPGEPLSGKARDKATGFPFWWVCGQRKSRGSCNRGYRSGVISVSYWFPNMRTGSPCATPCRLVKFEIVCNIGESLRRFDICRILQDVDACKKGFAWNYIVDNEHGASLTRRHSPTHT
jgi:hypothetical protein